jgi:hypothetical protein
MRILFLLFILISSLSCRKFVWDNPYDTGNTNSSSEPASLKNGLVAYYPFNGNANDESGNGNNGTIKGAILSNDRKGNPNSSYSFSANSDIITATSSQYPENFTVSLWCKILSPWSYTTFNMFKLGPINPVTYGGFSLRYDQNDQAYGSSNYRVYGAISSSTTFLYNSSNNYDFASISQWHHYVFTRNNNLSNLYVDNVLVSAELHPSLTIEFTSAIIQIGNQQNLNNNQCGVRVIDDIRVYNRALTQEEITYLANN